METIRFILKPITLNMYFRKIDLKDACILSQYIKTTKNMFAWRKLYNFFWESYVSLRYQDILGPKKQKRKIRNITHKEF